MSLFTGKTGSRILRHIGSYPLQYGLNNLSKKISSDYPDLTITQVKDLINQLIQEGYLKVLEYGEGFHMPVIGLTEKGKEAVTENADVRLDYERFLKVEYRDASDNGVVDRELLDEYRQVKTELMRMQEKEADLKETIKRAMTEKGASEIRTDTMDITLKTVERVSYPKEKIERDVPEELLQRIRETQRITILSAKMKR